MLRSILLIMALGGTCAAQPPSRLDRIVLPSRPNVEKDRRRLIEHADVMIPLLEDLIKMNENAIRDFGFTPEGAESVRETLINLRKALAMTKATRQELLDQEAKALKQKLLEEEAKAKPVPLAPMPHEKRTD